MKNWLFLIFITYTAHTYSQTLSLNEIKFSQIRSLDYTLPEGTNKPVYKDTAFNYFIIQKTRVLQFLIDQIPDTSLTTIERKSTNGFYKKGDLAIVLLSNIEFIPYALITHSDWCFCCETGYIPVGFFSYLDRNRLDFQLKYKNYCLEQERKRSSKQNNRNRKS
jgi:hypothetical protein